MGDMLSRPSPYLLLILTAIFWASNFVIGRGVSLDIPPIGLSFWRWFIALLILAIFSLAKLKANWDKINGALPLLIFMGILGVAGFNTLVYIGLQSTTATNGLLLLSTTPVFIILLSRLLLGQPISSRQLGGVVISLIGVVVIIGRGEILTPLLLQFGAGDLWILVAVFIWALYSVLLRRCPTDLDPLAFLAFTVVVGVVGLIPLLLWEMGQGTVIHFDFSAVATILYIAIFPSILAYLFWNRAVAEIGANRAGQFLHLMPIFGTLMAVLFLGELIHWFHLSGFVLIMGGIFISQKSATA